VVGAGEGPVTEATVEGSVPGVFPIVSRQLIRAGKFPSAPFLVALVGSLSGVGLEMGGLGVGLGAARFRASVDYYFSTSPIPSSLHVGGGSWIGKRWRGMRE